MTKGLDNEVTIALTRMTRGRSRERGRYRRWIHVIKSDPCCWCGIRLPPADGNNGHPSGRGCITLDHITPVINTGKRRSRRIRIDDATAACSACNWARGSQKLWEFMSSDWLRRRRRQVEMFNKNKRTRKRR